MSDSPDNDSLSEQSQTKTCSKCGQEPEQYLALQCDHNLCLPCAAKTLSKLQQQSSPNQNLTALTCDICSAVTILDPNTAYTLEAYVNAHSSNDNTQDYTDNLTPRQLAKVSDILSNDHSSNPQVDKDPAVMEPQSLLTQTPEYCLDHPDEIANIYCFTCDVPCICVECLVSGFHKGHDVKNVKKALGSLHDMVDEILLKVKAKIESLVSTNQKLTQHEREMVDANAHLKSQMQKAFDEVRARLDNKEKELLSAADTFVNEKYAVVEKKRREVRERIDSLLNVVRQLEEVFKESRESVAFNYYAENKRRIIKNVEGDSGVSGAGEFAGLVDAVNMRLYLDTKSLQGFIEEVHNVHLAVASLRGVEDIRDVSQVEKSYFEKAKEDRLRRTINQALNTKSSPSSTLKPKVSFLEPENQGYGTTVSVEEDFGDRRRLHTDNDYEKRTSIVSPQSSTGKYYYSLGGSSAKGLPGLRDTVSDFFSGVNRTSATQSSNLLSVRRFDSPKVVSNLDKLGRMLSPKNVKREAVSHHVSLLETLKLQKEMFKSKQVHNRGPSAYNSGSNFFK